MGKQRQNILRRVGAGVARNASPAKREQIWAQHFSAVYRIGQGCTPHDPRLALAPCAFSTASKARLQRQAITPPHPPDTTADAGLAHLAVTVHPVRPRQTASPPARAHPTKRFAR